LKWASLLHDIVKKGPPVHEGKDHIHPFMGAKVTLQIFKRLKILTISDEQESVFEELIKLIDDSV
jgi:hypothetical protein